MLHHLTASFLAPGKAVGQWCADHNWLLGVYKHKDAPENRAREVKDDKIEDSLFEC